MTRDGMLAWIGGLALGLLEVMPTGGFLPVFWVVLAGSVAAALGSLSRPATPKEAFG